MAESVGSLHCCHLRDRTDTVVALQGSTPDLQRTRAEFVVSLPSDASLCRWGTDQRGSQGWNESRRQVKDAQWLCVAEYCHTTLPCIPPSQLWGPLGVTRGSAWPDPFSRTQPPRASVPLVPCPSRFHLCLSWPPAAQGQLPASTHKEGVPAKPGSVCGRRQVSSLFLFSLHCSGNILYSQIIPFNYTTIKHIIKT